MAHGDAREGKWRGNWRMEWVASTFTPPRNVVYPALLPPMRASRLPAVDWTDVPADLNGLVRFGERRNLVSAHVPSRFTRALPPLVYDTDINITLTLLTATFQEIEQIKVCEISGSHNSTAEDSSVMRVSQSKTRYLWINTLLHTAGCEMGSAIDAFAVNSSFLSADGITCLIPFESWRNDLSNGISHI